MADIEETRLIAATESQLSSERGRERELLCAKFNSFLIDLEELEMNRLFQVGDRLGRGRQGVVFKVVCSSFPNCETRHAIKVFDPSLFAENRHYDVEMLRIAKQVSVLQQLYHPNLVQCESFFEYDQMGMLIMELIEGVDIRSLMNPEAHRELYRRLPAEEWAHYNSVVFGPERHSIQPGIAFYIIRKVLRGLEILHRTGYIHCDIKPSNVMIDRFGTVKIIDFGRATQINDPRDHFLASPMYMAPEVHRRHSISPQSDIYSCGMVLLEMLHGGHVIDMYATERQIYEFKLKLPDQIGEFLSKQLRRNKQLMNILRGMLAVDLHERYETAEDADVGTTGANLIHKQLAKADLDTDYGLELETYLAHRIPRSEVIARRRLKQRT